MGGVAGASERADLLLSAADFVTDGAGVLRSPSGTEWVQVWLPIHDLLVRTSR
jgi:hypothetical protein